MSGNQEYSAGSGVGIDTILGEVFGQDAGRQGVYATAEEIAATLRSRGYDVKKEEVARILDAAVEAGKMDRFIGRSGNSLDIVYGWKTKIDIPRISNF